MSQFEYLRKQMIDTQLSARGLHDETVLNAVTAVPREDFVPTELVEFAYNDSPLPIGASQTISQPYIVALMTAALNLQTGDRVLEIGTGSGYAAAVLAEIAAEVYTVERNKILADSARNRLADLGYKNIQVLHGDGTLGWPNHAPFNAIIVAAGGPEVPETLKQQLAIGGRLVIPVGTSLQTQKLLRVRRITEQEYIEEDMGSVRFVPLIGAAGWEDETATAVATGNSEASLPELIFKSSEHFASIDHVNLDKLLARIGDSRLVLLDEASHGTAEFYEMRARITRELIEKKGFTIVAVEADWPDAAHLDHYIHDTAPDPMLESTPFSRFPTWMWSNTSVLEFIDWLRAHNEKVRSTENKVGFYGLDLYSLSSSIEAVLSYLDTVDPETAEVARVRYGCLTPWANDPALYGRMTRTKEYRACEAGVLATLQDLMKKRLDYSIANCKQFFDAKQNARLIANAERYYRTLYYAENNSWNQRDRHMFETLQSVMKFRGPQSKAVIWAHNSHIGDARATEMSARGEFNVGELVRKQYGDAAYIIGFGTDHGTVAAASEWGGPMEIKQVQPAHIDSYERIFHDVNTDNFLLPLRYPLQEITRQKLLQERLQRAIGVIYRPEAELQSHYFYASLPHQFDEYIWFDETRAVEPVTRKTTKGTLDTFPFGV
ncbi:protein-L-isoaspartate(D-aspartate) O-methyltransferase [Nitrosomonas mobilis]|uniref:Protein-L-isoaspartate O-methyltransferase n=1 Tax=Nitrosomonas mobilis TaxID=51642 RepID=A0A1G5SG76_9PROT|nr:protein-L-isoaspartate(D-aspartate) O-methyltransferase [Nitrosomonas mobilis]SCZ86128.1 Protein-L-isoaspartate O-methyltransferase [Nitrosomonas mobilis]